jgi:CubicO group peptidase (beta-lactamase class C family)
MKNLIRYFLILCSVAYCFSPFSTIYGQGIPAVDSLITQQIAAKNISGGVAYVWHQNKVIVDKAYGFVDRDKQIIMQPNAIFRLASNTKAIISISVLQLVEKGKIRLDDPIELYIPAFGNQKVFTNPKDTVNLVNRVRSVTVRDLLTHQSGISSTDEYPAFKWAFEKYHLNAGLGKYYASLEEEVNQIAAMPLVHQPGERFSYGLSTNVLGRLIEVCSGLSLDKYLKKNIFYPLGMEDTYFYLPEEKSPATPREYQKKALKILKIL